MVICQNGVSWNWSIAKRFGGLYCTFFQNCVDCVFGCFKAAIFFKELTAVSKVIILESVCDLTSVKLWDIIKCNSQVHAKTLLAKHYGRAIKSPGSVNMCNWENIPAKRLVEVVEKKTFVLSSLDNFGRRDIHHRFHWTFSLRFKWKWTFLEPGVQRPNFSAGYLNLDEVRFYFLQ